MYVIKNMKHKQKEWHPGTKSLKFGNYQNLTDLPPVSQSFTDIV
jgi:hypothetical protein